MAWVYDTYDLLHPGQNNRAVVTGKPLELGGSVGRADATGRGALYATQQLLRRKAVAGLDSLEAARVAVQGLGQVGATAMRLFHEAGARIVAVSDSGGASRLISEYRPDANIVALTTDEVAYRRLAMVWGVTPVLIGPSATTEELIDRVEATLIERNLALPGENVLITMAVPVGSGVQTNVLKIHQIQH